MELNCEVQIFLCVYLCRYCVFPWPILFLWPLVVQNPLAYLPGSWSLTFSFFFSFSDYLLSIWRLSFVSFQNIFRTSLFIEYSPQTVRQMTESCFFCAEIIFSSSLLIYILSMDYFSDWGRYGEELWEGEGFFCTCTLRFVPVTKLNFLFHRIIES